jgi:hypothetical protein
MIGYLTADQLFFAVLSIIADERKVSIDRVAIKQGAKSFQVAMSHVDTNTNEGATGDRAYLDGAAQACDKLVTRLTCYRQVIVPPVPHMFRTHRLEPNVRAFQQELQRTWVEHGSTHATSFSDVMLGDLSYTLYVYISHFVEQFGREKKMAQRRAAETRYRGSTKWDANAVMAQAPSLADLVIGASRPEMRGNHPFNIQQPKPEENQQ